jgi:hypothetical protein
MEGGEMKTFLIICGVLVMGCFFYLAYALMKVARLVDDDTIVRIEKRDD